MVIGQMKRTAKRLPAKAAARKIHEDIYPKLFLEAVLPPAVTPGSPCSGSGRLPKKILVNWLS
jgi:hypothetical protein